MLYYKYSKSILKAATSKPLLLPFYRIAVLRFPYVTCSVGPVGPVGPVTPVAPVAPVGPVGPVGPVTPPEDIRSLYTTNSLQFQPQVPD